MESSEYRNPPGGSPGWATWVAFAGIMLILIGIFEVIAGLAAAFEDDYFVRGAFEGDVLVVSTQTLGIYMIIIGFVKLFTGFALIQGREWARIVTVILLILNAIAAIAVLNQQPFLSIIYLIFDIVILYAVTVRWQAAKIGMGD